MDIVRRGQVSTFAEVPAGACFVFRRDATMYVGLKAALRDHGRDIAWPVALSPGHPDAQGKPGLFHPQRIERPVLHLPDAKLVPAVEPIKMNAGEINYEHGMLVNSGERFLLAAQWERNTCLVDIDSGELLRHAPDLPGIWFSAWSVVQPVLGRPEVICQFPPV